MGSHQTEMIDDLFDNVESILKAPDEILPNPKEGAEDTILFAKKVNSQGRDRYLFAVFEVGADREFLEIKTIAGPDRKSGTLKNARKLKKEVVLKEQPMGG